MGAWLLRMEQDDDERQRAPTEDIELAGLAADGDSTALRTLLESQRPQLQRFIEMRIDAQLRRRVDASDVLQETFLRAHQKLGDYLERRPMPLRVWLLRTAMDQLRDARIKHLKRQRRAGEREIVLADHSSMVLAEQLATHSTASKEIMRREEMQRVADVIDSMPPGDREILLLRHHEDLKFEEIGSLLEITAVNARKRYARALLKLQRLCTEMGISPKF